MQKSKLPYLDEILDTTPFKIGQANVIIAPCHSGKTTAAQTLGKKLNCHDTRVLYLIDTTAGKEALLEKPNMLPARNKWVEQ